MLFVCVCVFSGKIANALSIKTPKQLVQEYQNRNPGRAIRREIVEGPSGGFNCVFYIDEKVAAMVSKCCCC